MAQESINIWGEEGAEESPSSQSLDMQREWETRRVQFHNLGYSDGITAGKQSSVQEGFNQGFKESIRPALRWGVCRGASSAYAALPPVLQAKLLTDQGARQRLAALNSTISQISSAAAMEMYYNDSVLRGSRLEPATTLSEAVQTRGVNESGARDLLTVSGLEKWRDEHTERQPHQGIGSSSASSGSELDNHGSLDVADAPRSGEPNAYVQRMKNPLASHLRSMTLSDQRSSSTDTQDVESVSRLQRYRKSVEAELQGSGTKLNDLPVTSQA